MNTQQDHFQVTVEQPTGSGVLISSYDLAPSTVSTKSNMSALHLFSVFIHSSPIKHSLFFHFHLSSASPSLVLLSTLLYFPQRWGRGRRGEGRGGRPRVRLMHLPWQRLDLGVWPVSNVFFMTRVYCSHGTEKHAWLKFGFLGCDKCYSVKRRKKIKEWWYIATELSTKYCWHLSPIGVQHQLVLQVKRTKWPLHLFPLSGIAVCLLQWIWSSNRFRTASSTIPLLAGKKHCGDLSDLLQKTHRCHRQRLQKSARPITIW